MSTPTVSIVVPTYNRQTLLPRALDSILAQTFDDWEIVLVDDGSTDATAEVAARYSNQLRDRLVLVQQPNRGSSAARNRGIETSRGRYVAFLDSDDEFLPRKLERQLDLFRRSPDLGLVYGDYAFVDAAGVRHESAFAEHWLLAHQVPHERIAPGLCVCTGELFDMLIRGYFISTIVGMVRRDALGDAIRFPEHCTYAEEWLFYLKVVKAWPAGFVDEPLCLHHHVPGSLARSDKAANTRGYRDVLNAIRTSFDDLTPAQERALHGQLAQTHRQLAYDARRGDQPRTALSHFALALRHRPSWRAAWECVSAVPRGLADRFSLAGSRRAAGRPIHE